MYITMEETLTPLHPSHVKEMRVQALLTSVPFVIAALVLETSDLLFPGVFLVPVVLAALFIVLRVPLRRYSARGYAMGDDRLRVAKGLLFRSDTVVPFGRVQHIDVNQGPLERAFGLATLTLYTAGSHNASVTVPGLGHAKALEMREAIRAHIRRDTI